MKKRLLFLFCGMMCLFLLLCSCGDDGDTGNSLPTESGSHTHSGEHTHQSGDTNSSVNEDESIDSGVNGDITSPETPCELNKAGHYWSNVSINKNTSAQGTVALSGKCHLCGDELYKVCTSIVDYEQFKNALSSDSLSSFTAVLGAEYTDYDENGSLTWRINKGVYTADYYINSKTKNSREYAKNFQGFSFNNFTYNSTSKTYVYWFDVNSYVELGFADGDLIYHSVGSKNGDEDKKTQTLYLNHNRISVESPNFAIDKYNAAVTKEALDASSLDADLVDKVFSELKSFSFDGSFEASLLENDRLCVYFYIDEARQNPVVDGTYTEASVTIEDTKIISFSFGKTVVEIG